MLHIVNVNRLISMKIWIMMTGLGGGLWGRGTKMSSKANCHENVKALREAEKWAERREVF